MNHSGKIMKSIVMGISIFIGLSVVSTSVMSATYPAPAVSNLPAVVDGTSTPVRILLDPAGGYYVSDTRAGGVLKYDKDGNLSKMFTSDKVHDAVGMAFSSTGELLVTHGTTIERLDPTTGVVLGSFGTFLKAHGIAVDAAGNIYVTDSINDCVQKFGPGPGYPAVNIATAVYGKPANSFGSTGLAPTQFKRPAGITYEKVSGQLAIADSLNGRIQFYSTAGVMVSSLGSFGSGPLSFVMPKGIAFEYAGSPAVVSRYYVVDSFQSNIQVIDAPTKQWLGFIGRYGYLQGELVAPSDIQIDQSDPLSTVLFVANEIGILTRYGIDSLVPTNVVVLPATVSNELTITWTNPGIASFRSVNIYRSTTPGVLGTKIASNVMGETYASAGLVADTKYYYTVRGVNSGSAESTNTDQYSGTTLSYGLLNITTAGNGVGTVSSDLPQPGLTLSNGVYSATVKAGTVVTLLPMNDAFSTFTGWTGNVCNNQPSGNCVFTMTAAVNVTANFDMQHKFKIKERSIYDDIFQNIYGQASTGETIMVVSGTAPAFDDTLFLNMTATKGSEITVIGGYDSNFNAATTTTTLVGAVKITSGKIIFKNIKIK